MQTRYRDGELNGVSYTYRINPEGRSTFAEVGDWVIRSRIDEMDDSQHWYIDQDEAKLMVTPSPSGQAARFCVLGHDFPGRYAMVRVDNRPPVTASTDECFTSPALFASLLSASTLRTRRYEWPYDVGEIADGGATGFSEALLLYAYMKRTIFSPL